jgi:hypothetical protein
MSGIRITLISFQSFAQLLGFRTLHRFMTRVLPIEALSAVRHLLHHKDFHLINFLGESLNRLISRFSVLSSTLSRFCRLFINVTARVVTLLIAIRRALVRLTESWVM